MAFDDVIFVAGGVDVNGNVLNSTEVYNLSNTTPSWFTAVPMLSPRSDFGIALAADGYLHAFGGLTTGGTQLKTIEGYQFGTGKWTKEPHALPEPLSGIAVTETLSGADFIVGGKSGSTFETKAIRARAPKVASHTVTFFVHSVDEPYVLGNAAMDQIPPLNRCWSSKPWAFEHDQLHLLPRYCRYDRVGWQSYCQHSRYDPCGRHQYGERDL